VTSPKLCLPTFIRGNTIPRMVPARGLFTGISLPESRPSQGYPREYHSRDAALREGEITLGIAPFGGSSAGIPFPESHPARGGISLPELRPSEGHPRKYHSRDRALRGGGISPPKSRPSEGHPREYHSRNLALREGGILSPKSRPL
jgi:hypothetical protein